MRRFWRELAGAIRGERPDLTHQPLRRSIVLLAVPLTLESLLSTLFFFFDTFFIGRLGRDAVAGAGVTEAAYLVVYAAAQGLAVAALATVSRRVGEEDVEAAHRVTGQVILLAVALGLGLGILGVIHAERVLRLMGAGEDVVEASSGYAVVLFGGSITVLLSMTINAALRGTGAVGVTLRVLAVAHGVNLVLDPLLIFGLGPLPAFGIQGAAMATNTAWCVAIAVQIAYLRRTSGLQARHLRPDVALLGRLLRLAAVATLQNFLFVMAPAAVMRILAPFSAAALAGYTLAWRITLFVMKPVWGLARTAGILVGVNLGAGRPERAEEAVWTVARYNLLILGAVAGLFFAAAPAVVAFFIDSAGDSETVAYGAECLRFMGAGYLFMAYGLVLRSAFNGAGDATTPTWITLAGDWGFRVGLALLLAWGLGYGPTGVFAAGCAAEAVTAAASVIAFRRGAWKTRRV